MGLGQFLLGCGETHAPPQLVATKALAQNQDRNPSTFEYFNCQTTSSNNS